MSQFGFRHRFQEAALDDKGGGGDNQQQQPADWLKPFGDSAKAFESFKEPGEFVKAWTDTQAELTALKGKQPEDWRKQIGGEDPEAQKVLQRFADPKTFFKSFSDAQAKIRSGELQKPLAADATPEQIAEYRKAHGVPEKPEGYFEKLPNGRVIGADDQPMFTQVAERLHKLNVSPAVMHELADWYYASEEQQTAAERKVDDADRIKAIQDLRTEWGEDYRPNMNIMESWLDGLGKDLKAHLKDAVLGDGTRLMNNPSVVKWLVAQARTVNPAAGLIPGGGDVDIKTIDTEIAGIEKVMRESRSTYDKDEKMQARLRDLYTAREALKKQTGK